DAEAAWAIREHIAALGARQRIADRRAGIWQVGDAQVAADLLGEQHRESLAIADQVAVAIAIAGVADPVAALLQHRLWEIGAVEGWRSAINRAGNHIQARMAADRVEQRARSSGAEVRRSVVCGAGVEQPIGEEVA